MAIYISKRHQLIQLKNSLSRQQAGIVKNYPCYKCNINWKKLELLCRGKIESSITSNSFNIEIKYNTNASPSVFIRKPNITPSHSIHMYDDGSLCLYHPSQIKWNRNALMSEITIPRIAEWLMYYELWKLTGEWEGPEYLHNISKKTK